MQIFISAGDAITAKLVKEGGFDGIWVSGFESCARLGLPDNGTISIRQMVKVVEPIVNVVTLPVYVDVDTGYNDFNKTVKAFESIGVAGICVEDNMPKKQNSLWGGQVPLMPIEEYCAKLERVRDRKIKIIARTEALIRGYGYNEAIKRAKAYAVTGADYILIHTRDESGKEAKMIPYFCRDIKLPLVIVPTKFPSMTNTQLAALGYDTIIWANQIERTKIKAIRKALDRMKRDDCARGVEAKLSVTLDDMKGLMPV